ncbi:hypothetical protein Lal_00003272 [Lupinus albus]|nr:hypothetical protein Lal_00003272 [Lupinus albus]
MASRSLSNNSFGTVPSNSLNLRSRNFSFGNRNTTAGNFPAKRLLLRSNSNRMTSFSNFLGTVPQKRLLLMWKSARSVRSPSSSERVHRKPPYSCTHQIPPNQGLDYEDQRK